MGELTDRAQVREDEVAAKDFQDVTPSADARQCHREADAALHHTYLSWRHLHNAEFSCECQRPCSRATRYCLLCTSPVRHSSWPFPKSCAHLLLPHHSTLCQVKKRSGRGTPCSGTTSMSPSPLLKQVFSMDAFALYMWIAYPSFLSGLRPSTPSHCQSGL